MAYINPRFKKFIGGNGIEPTGHIAEADSQTFKKGAPIVEASGLGGEADPATLSTFNSDEILGLARRNGNNDTDNDELVFTLWLPGVQFLMTLDDSGASPYSLLQTDLGVAYGLNRDAASLKWYVDKARVTTAARVKIVKFFDPVGTSQARVYAQVLGADGYA